MKKNTLQKTTDAKFQQLINYCNDSENFDRKTFRAMSDDYMRYHKQAYPYLKAK